MELTRNGFRRVVITGMGGVTPLGRFPGFLGEVEGGYIGGPAHTEL